jgi:hypothetical protein
MKKMDINQWVEEFDPLHTIHGSLVRFETYGEDIELVNKMNPLHVWTEVETGQGNYIIEGVHYVNRINYFITVKPRTNNDSTYEIKVEA